MNFRITFSDGSEIFTTQDGWDGALQLAQAEHVKWSYSAGYDDPKDNPIQLKTMKRTS